MSVKDKVKKAIYSVTDGWNSVLNSFSFKSMYENPTLDAYTYSDQALRNAYKDPTIKNIVNSIVDDGMKKTFHIDNLDSDIVSVVENKLTYINFNDRLKQSWTDSRIIGQSYILLITDEDTGAYSEPIGDSELINVQVFTEGVIPRSFTTDVKSNNFGLPASYDISNGYIQFHNIHYSRICRIDGGYLPEESFIQNRYRNESIIGKVYNSVSQLGIGRKSIAPLIDSFNTKILKLENLMDIQDKETEENLKNRLKLTQQSQAEQNIIFLGENDEYQNNTINLSNVDRTLDILNNAVSSDSKIPNAILFGDTISGLNATGNLELEIYYKLVKQEQVRVLEKCIRSVIDQIMKFEYGQIFDYDIVFPPIKELTEVEEADYRLKVATAMEKMIDLGVLSPEEVRESLFANKFSQNIELIDGSLDVYQENQEELI